VARGKSSEQNENKGMQNVDSEKMRNGQNEGDKKSD